MDVILPFRIKNEKKFFECAFKLGFDEMSAQKFFYITHQSDLDIFPKMGDERLNIVLYGWEMCEDYKLKLNQDEWELPEELEAMLKVIVPWSLDIWFSKEWDRCKLLLKHTLIHCLNRARGLLMRLPDMMQINWDFLLLYNLTPWQVTYLKTLTVTKEKTLENGALTIETEEQLATSEDLSYIKMEQLPLIVLRLVKLFDQSSIDMVKTLCMRVIAAWNKVYSTELEKGGSRYVLPEDKRCLLLICHIYLMAIYETDDVTGYVIDNMINNIRFYHQGFQISYASENMKYTPARFIALTAIHLRLQKREFFDFFIWNSLDTSQVNLFGVVSQAYKSYLLGNLLMELNNMNEDDFAANVALYKRLMNSYVNEREKSEIFMTNEMQKQELQHYAHNIIQCVPNMTNFKSKICKGNRMSNIGHYENTDVDKVGDVQQDGAGKKEEESRVDPIFQNIPNNQDILYYVYDVLSKKSYNGWHFAKIVLLFKIISHELNMIETWRYHPGLTINFMLNLETKMSQHYTDLAKIFIDYPFIEQEFCLTAFYLNPTSYNYEVIKRLGIRNNRKRSDEQGRWVTGKDKIEAKYGLLSSTIDVKEITNLSNTEEQKKDYDPLFQALCSLHLPDSMVKDILTVVFLPRNKSFSWAVDWNDLRRRCKMLMSNSSEKKRFVELNMAEANDRLKFLKIDYEKYKNRPQLDYGSIEQGYENLMNTADMDEESEEESEEEDFEDDEDVYETQKGRGAKKQPEIIEDDNSQEEDPYLTGKRRTRARAAAAMASLLFTSELTSRRKRRKKDEEEAPKDNDEGIIDGEEKSNDTATIESLTLSNIDEANSKIADIPKKNIKECLKERPLYANPTFGFQPLIDMWNIQKSDLETIDSDSISLLESSSVLHRFTKLKNINKEINPTATDDAELIDDMEMLKNLEHSSNEKNALKTDTPREQPEQYSFICKEPPVGTEVPEEMAKSVDSQDTIQNSEQDNKNAKIDNSKDDETNVNEHDSENSSVTKDLFVEGDIISDKPEISTEEINAEGKNDDKSITNEENVENIEEYINQQQSPAGKVNADEDQKDKNEDVTIAENQESAAIDINVEKNHKTVAQTGEKEIIVSAADKLESTALELPVEAPVPYAEKVDCANADNPENNTMVIKNAQVGDLKENADANKTETPTMDVAEAEENDGVVANRSETNVMDINDGKESDMADIAVNPETTAMVISDVGEMDIQEESVSDSNAVAASNGNEKDMDDTTIADNQEINAMIIEDEQQKIIELPEQKENEAFTSIFESPQTIAMDVDGEHESDIKLPELNEDSTTLGGKNLTYDEQEAENKDSIMAKQIESIERAVVINDTKENDNETLDKIDAHVVATPAIAKDELESIKLETEAEEAVDKITELITGSKTETGLGTSDEDENKTPGNTPALIFRAKTQSPSEEKSLKEPKSSFENATEIFELTKIEIDFDQIIESVKIIASRKTDDKSTESAESTGQCDDKSIVISDEITDTKPNDTAMDVDDRHINTHGCDMPLLESEDSNVVDEPMDKDFKLKRICLTKPLKVLIRRLRPSELTNLRQPKVRLKRIKNVEVFLQQTTAKLNRFPKRQVYIDESSDTSLMSNTSSSDAYRPPKSKTKAPLRRHVLRQNRTSDSDCDSNKSHLNLQTRRVSTPNASSNQSNNTSRSSSRPSAGNLVVTPRSASGLKLRISHADQKSQILHGKPNLQTVDEIIQLSSSSNDSNTMDSIADVVEIPDPLFEEEMVI